MQNVILVSTFGVKLEDGLTRDEGHGVELLIPVVGDSYLGAGLVLVLDGVAHLVRIPDELLGVVRLHRGHDVEEVAAVREAALGVSVLEILHEFRILLHQRKERSNRQFVVMGHLNEPHLTEL